MDSSRKKTGTTPISGGGGHAERFRRVRNAHQSETAEDYVELIAELMGEKGEARLVDLAERSASPRPR